MQIAQNSGRACDRRAQLAREPRRVLKAGTAATSALTALAVPALGLGLLRLNFGRMLGTALGPDRPRTQALGWGVHVLNGLVLAGGYQLAFRALHARASAPRGAALGLLHGAAALAGLALLPRVHPRPLAAGLKPLSPAAYGPLTVPGMLLGHVVYGAVLGAMLNGASPRGSRRAARRGRPSG